MIRLGLCWFACLAVIQAQTVPVTPSSPKEFKKRDLGGALGTGAVGVKAPKKVSTITYIAVSEERAFANTSGKLIMAQLIAFEEGDPAKVDRPLTLIKDGKIRLLVKGRGKASVVPLEKLREEDRAYVKALDAANKATAKKDDPSEDS